MSKIWVAGVGFDVETNVVRWDEPGGFNAMLTRCTSFPRPTQPCRGGGVYPYSEHVPLRARRYRERAAMRGEFTLAAAQGVIRQFILHHDGCPNAQVCFNVLHNERGLSCHFLLDNDGTIYQTMDLAYMAFHAAGFNARSIGVEISNRGDAKRYPNYYPRGRDVTTCRIHDHTYLAYEYTDAQYEALEALGRGLARALPNLPIDYPQDSPGHQAWSLSENVRSYAGYLGHYHTTRRKWDPGPFDFKAFCERIRGRRSFPLAVVGDSPHVPEDTDELREVTAALYRNSEEELEGGYFPVGKLGKSKLWHGGLHLSGKRDQALYSPFAGRIVAARMGQASTAGSANFVLLRHELSVGPSSIRFFSLFFHLADEIRRDSDEGAPAWTESDTWRERGRPGQIVLLDEPIEAGHVVGRVGDAGPAEYRSPQIHFEVFASEEVGGAVQPNTWTVIDGTPGGRFSADQGVLAELDADRDGELTRRELIEFFAGDANRRLIRYLATLHVSEWTDSPDWVETLKRAPELSDRTPEELQRLYRDQIEPTLWWTADVARHARLPRDGVVYHYHPITFVKFINEKLLEAQVLADVGVGAFSHDEAAETPEGVYDDREDVSGSSFVEEAELEDEDYGHDLTLEDLMRGFPE